MAELLCNLCNSGFDKSEKAPLLISCGHTFCKQCLVQLYSGEHCLKCPTCGTEESRSPESLPQNLILCDSPKKHKASPNSSDPWLCQFHTGRKLDLICQHTHNLYCSECLTAIEVSNLSLIPIDHLYQRFELFAKLYTSCSEDELTRRTELFAILQDILSAHRLKIGRRLDSGYSQGTAVFKNRFGTLLNKVLNSLNAEQQSLADFSQVFSLLEQLKRLDCPLDQDSLRFATPTQLEAARNLVMGGHPRRVSQLTRLRRTTKTFKSEISLPKDAIKVTELIHETTSLALEGIRGWDGQSEQKLSRFSSVGGRWGLFDDRFQVDAVTFSTNKKIILTGLGIGNANSLENTVLVTRVAILDGPATDSPALYSATDILLEYVNTDERVVKIPLEEPVTIEADRDYTIWFNLLGAAGIFCGDLTSLIRSDENVRFTFKQTTHSADMVRNGNNETAGPIFDLYYKVACASVHSVISLDGIISQTVFMNADLVETFSIRVSHPCKLTGLSVGAPADSLSALNIQTVEIYACETLILKEVDPVLVTQSEQTMNLLLNSPVSLNHNQPYRVFIKYYQKGSLFRRIPSQQTLYTSDEFTASFFENIGESLLGKVVSECWLDLTISRPFTLSEIPEGLPTAETCISRFESAEGNWSVSGANQVESFSFVFDRRVILTAVGIGASTSSDNVSVLRSLKVLSGPSTRDPAVYASQRSRTLNKDLGPVVKVSLDPPVEVMNGHTYTIRAVLRGSNCSRGNRFRGSTQVLPDGVIFTSFAAKYTLKDYANGNNETDGPIISLYYTSDSLYTANEFQLLKEALFPFISPTQRDCCVQRAKPSSSTFLISHQIDQVGGIAFRVSGSAIRLTSIGLSKSSGSAMPIKKLQIREGQSTRGKKLYCHSFSEGVVTEATRLSLSLGDNCDIDPETWYTVRVKYIAGSRVCSGYQLSNQLTVSGVTFTFAKTSYEGSDVQQSNHEIEQAIQDLHFIRL